MGLCNQCREQVGKSHRGKPHAGLDKLGELRIFKGRGARGFEQQDYQCRHCQARFTHSGDRNDLAWTLWQG